MAERICCWAIFKTQVLTPFFRSHYCNHVRSDAILIWRNQIRSSHAPTVSNSPNENIWFHGRDQDSSTTSNLRWLKLNRMSTYTFGWVRAFAVYDSFAIFACPWHFQSTSLFPGQGKLKFRGRWTRVREDRRRRHGLSAAIRSAVSGGARDWQCYGGARPSRIKFFA